MTPKEKIYTARVLNKLTQPQLAHMADLSLVTISHVESGHVPVSKRTAARVEKALGLPEGCIMNGKDIKVIWR